MYIYSAYIFSISHEQCAIRTTLLFLKFISQMFNSTDKSLENEMQPLML